MHWLSCASTDGLVWLGLRQTLLVMQNVATVPASQKKTYICHQHPPSACIQWCTRHCHLLTAGDPTVAHDQRHLADQAWVYITADK